MLPASQQKKLRTRKDMPLLPEDQKLYMEFIQEQVKALGSFDFDPKTTIWHYTTGTGLLGIVQSGTLYSTQVSCLNDSTEIRYASSKFKKALAELLPKYSAQPAAVSFLTKYLKLIEEEPDRPTHAPSPFFVTCFTQEEDDLTQWRGYGNGENGYAIGFPAALLFDAPNVLLARVSYDGALHEQLAAAISERTVQFFLEGIGKKRADTAEKWEDEFLTFWDPNITRLAPLVKDPGFAAEKEYRIVHEFKLGELRELQFVQKATMMSRHLPLSFSQRRRSLGATVANCKSDRRTVPPSRDYSRFGGHSSAKNGLRTWESDFIEKAVSGRLRPSQPQRAIRSVRKSPVVNMNCGPAHVVRATSCAR
jgi:hypothetical protein